MLQETEGIILRQIKTGSGRRMVVIFTRRFGKISVGTNMTEGGKNKTALSIRPFTYGRYSMYTGKDSYNLSSGQVVKSFFNLGENLDKFMEASYVLELTDRVLAEDLPQPGMFEALLEYLEALEKREKKLDTIKAAYMVKVLDCLGSMPNMNCCSRCGSEALKWFSVKEGGMVCEKCASEILSSDNEPLIYDGEFGIVNIINYLQKEPFRSFEKIGLDERVSSRLKSILREYFSYHLDVNHLKSEELSFE